MLITLWNYIRGYVTIELTGKGAMRFLNIAARSGICIWDVTPGKKGILLKVSVPAFWGLRAHARKAGCKMRISSRAGAPFVIHRYRNRKLLAAGALFFILGLYAMSLFIWQVETAGTDRLDPQEVVQAAARAGLHQSVLKPRIDRDHIEDYLLRTFPDISWVNITLRGTRATINLTETLPRQIIIDRRSPVDIVAARDGLIIRIVASAGTPVVRVHDVVSAGDILVSSEVVIREDETDRITDYVHADGMILARVYYDFNISVPFTYNIRNYTGNQRASYGIIIFGQSFTLPGIRHSFSSFSRQSAATNLSLGPHYPLPIVIESHTYREFTVSQLQRSTEEAKALAQALLISNISAKLPETAQIAHKQVHFLEHNPEALIARATVAVIENIAEKRLVVPNESN